MPHGKTDPTKISRPRYGLQPPAGWKILSRDENCAFCHQMACLRSPKGDVAHPSCLERHNRKGRR